MTKTVLVVTGIAAALCLFALPMWLLGVPGVDGNNYARGWRMGLNSILIYPAVWLVGFIVFIVLKRVRVQNIAQIETACSVFFALIFAVGLWRLFQSFAVMNAK